MKKCQLYEDKLPSKLPIVFSSKIRKTMEAIYDFNQDKSNNLFQWYSYIDDVQSYISNRVIAWDYSNRHIRFPNGAFYIRDFNYNVGYTIKESNDYTYVYVFMLNLKPEEFGLKVPSVNESLNNIIENVLNNYLKHNVLNESVGNRKILKRKDLKRIINVCVCSYLNENL